MRKAAEDKAREGKHGEGRTRSKSTFIRRSNYLVAAFFKSLLFLNM